MIPALLALRLPQQAGAHSKLLLAGAIVRPVAAVAALVGLREAAALLLHHPSRHRRLSRLMNR